MQALKAMAKKGAVTGYTVIWVATVLGILIPFYFVLNAVVEKSVDVSLSTQNLEHYLLFSRLFYSPNSIFYHDPYTGRANLEKVASDKFNEDTLKNLFGDQSSAKIALRLMLGGQEIYYNKNLYDFIEEVHIRSGDYGMAVKNKIVLVEFPDGREEKQLLTAKMGFCKKARC